MDKEKVNFSDKNSGSSDTMSKNVFDGQFNTARSYVSNDASVFVVHPGKEDVRAPHATIGRKPQGYIAKRFHLKVVEK